MSRAEIIRRVILEIVNDIDNCGFEKCRCSGGAEAFECLTGLSITAIVERIDAALDIPSQITPDLVSS